MKIEDTTGAGVDPLRLVVVSVLRAGWTVSGFLCSSTHTAMGTYYTSFVTLLSVRDWLVPTHTPIS